MCVSTISPCKWPSDRIKNWLIFLRPSMECNEAIEGLFLLPFVQNDFIHQKLFQLCFRHVYIVSYVNEYVYRSRLFRNHRPRALGTLSKFYLLVLFNTLYTTKIENKVKRTVERWVSENTKNLRTTYLSVAQRVVGFTVVCLYYTSTYLIPHIFNFFCPFVSTKMPGEISSKTT